MISEVRPQTCSQVVCVIGRLKIAADYSVVACKADDDPGYLTPRIACREQTHIRIDGTRRRNDLVVMRGPGFARMRDLGSVAHQESTIERNAWLTVRSDPDFRVFKGLLCFDDGRRDGLGD